MNLASPIMCQVGGDKYKNICKNCYDCVAMVELRVRVSLPAELYEK